MLHPVAAIAAALALTPAAFAEAPRTEVTFAYDPAKLSTLEGAEAAYSEIERIAERHCDLGVEGRLPLSSVRAEARCEAETIADIIEALDMPEMTAVYNTEAGASL